MLKTIEWTEGGVRMTDQTRLPAEEVYRTCHDYREVAEAIHSMVIRGAPAIGVAAAMGVALGVKNSRAATARELRAEFEIIADTISKTRPTAVNLFWAGKKIHVFADETRPFLQGARLTAWELARDGIPVTLITDSMAGHFMKQGQVEAAIVGADRIASNGDVANKIGTYTLAVLARENC